MFNPITQPTDVLILAIKTILNDASVLVHQHYVNYSETNTLEIYTKLDNSPVTNADLESNEFIISSLKKLTPNIPIISEENDDSKRKEWEKCWMLDPLDGTKEFLAKRPEFTINLSLIERGKTIFSAIAVPAQRMIYIGYTTEKPYKCDLTTNQWQQYTESKVNQVIAIGVSHRSESAEYLNFIRELKKLTHVRLEQAGSAYKFCLMLEGKIDLYPRFHPTSEWDTSAGQGLLESIGGGLVALNQKAFTYNQRSQMLNNGFIAYTHFSVAKLAFDVLTDIKKPSL